MNRKRIDEEFPFLRDYDKDCWSIRFGLNAEFVPVWIVIPGYLGKKYVITENQALKLIAYMKETI